MSKRILVLSTIIASFVFLVCNVSAAAVIRVAAGANPAAIQTMVNQFRTDLGGVNNGVGGSFVDGRREINWDGVPDNFAEPNALPFNFFNLTNTRGVDLHSIANIGANHQFRVSADPGS